MLVRVALSALLMLLSNLAQAQIASNFESPEAPSLSLPASVMPVLNPLAAANVVASAPTIFKRVDEVNLVLSVTNNHGRFVPDLNESDLVITDNGQPPVKITYFQSRTDLPLRVALVIDTSDSVAYRFAFEVKAGQSFLKKVLRPKQDSALIVTFNEHPRIVSPMTGDLGQLAGALGRLSPKGETALFDAITVASDQLGANSGADPARRVIVLVTDGEENRSKNTLAEAIEHALRAEAVIYVVNTKDVVITREDHNGQDIIERLAQSTGGRVLEGRTEQQVGDSFHKIQEELRSQYALGYRPQNLIGNILFRPIRIFGPKGIRIRTREGYYAASK